MTYKMEELIPVVAALAEEYTGRESSSIPYSKARQLMGAVLYCIREYEQGGKTGAGLLDTASEREAAAAYQAGYQIVLDKVKAAQNRCSEVWMEFKSYGSRAYQETVVDGLNAFFQYYDARFQPQEHLLTLDYPLLDTRQDLTGIDRIDHYIRCVELEQWFLSRLPEEYIDYVLCAYHEDYDELLLNVAEVVCRNLIGCMIAGKQIDSRPYTGPELERLKAFAAGRGRAGLEEVLGERIDYLVLRKMGGTEALAKYLKCDVKNFCAELLHAAKYGCLEQVLALGR